METETSEAEKTDEATEEIEAEGSENNSQGESETAVLEEGEEKSGEAADEEVEIVREDPASSQKSHQGRFNKRVNKLVGQRNTEKERADDLKQRLAQSEQEKLILQQSLQQAGDGVPLKPPNPKDFDGGRDDEDFIKQDKAYDRAEIKKEMAEHQDKWNQKNAVTQQQSRADTDLTKKQEAHWQRAAKLKVKDFRVVEDKAYDVLGENFIDDIIRCFPETSERITYFLGLDKNKDEANRFSALGVSDNRQCLIELTKLDVGLKVQPKSKNIIPNPDEDIEGGTPSGNQNSQKKLDKLREKAMGGDTASMSRVLAFKKECAGKGIQLE